MRGRDRTFEFVCMTCRDDVWRWGRNGWWHMDVMSECRSIKPVYNPKIGGTRSRFTRLFSRFIKTNQPLDRRAK